MLKKNFLRVPDYSIFVCTVKFDSWQNIFVSCVISFVSRALAVMHLSSCSVVCGEYAVRCWGLVYKNVLRFILELSLKIISLRSIHKSIKKKPVLSRFSNQLKPTAPASHDAAQMRFSHESPKSNFLLDKITAMVEQKTQLWLMLKRNCLTVNSSHL